MSLAGMRKRVEEQSKRMLAAPASSHRHRGKQGIGDFVFGDIGVAGNNTVRIEIVELARLKLVGTTDRAEQVVDGFGRLLCAVASNPAVGVVGVAEPACVLAGDQRREGMR